MEITEDTWMLAHAGDKSAMALIKERCKSDVRLTEKVYEKLLPVCQNHPAIYRMKGVEMDFRAEVPKQCQACGSKKGFNSRGKAFIGGRVKDRFRCKACQASVFVGVKKK